MALFAETKTQNLAASGASSSGLLAALKNATGSGAAAGLFASLLAETQGGLATIKPNVPETAKNVAGKNQDKAALRTQAGEEVSATPPEAKAPKEGTKAAVSSSNETEAVKSDEEEEKPVVAKDEEKVAETALEAESIEEVSQETGAEGAPGQDGATEDLEDQPFLAFCLPQPEAVERKATKNVGESPQGSIQASPAEQTEETKSAEPDLDGETVLKVPLTTIPSERPFEAQQGVAFEAKEAPPSAPSPKKAPDPVAAFPETAPAIETAALPAPVAQEEDKPIKAFFGLTRESQEVPTPAPRTTTKEGAEALAPNPSAQAPGQETGSPKQQSLSVGQNLAASLSFPVGEASSGAGSSASSASNMTAPIGEAGRTANTYNVTGQLAVAKNGASGTSQAVEQVAVQIHKMAKAGKEEMTIQLNPPDLGKVEVKLTFTDDKKVQAAVTVDKLATLQALEKDSAILQRALQDAGLQADAGCLQFSLRGDGAFGRAQTGAESGGKEGLPVLTAEDETEEAAWGGPETYYVTPERVNLRV